MGQVENLRADCQSALRKRVDNPLQDAILPYKQFQLRGGLKTCAAIDNRRKRKRVDNVDNPLQDAILPYKQIDPLPYPGEVEWANNLRGD